MAHSRKLPAYRAILGRWLPIYGVERAGAVTYQSVQTEIRDKPIRLYVVGFQLGRLGAPRKLVAGRQIMRSHFEMVIDRSAGLALGAEVPLGTHGHKFTIVGLTRNQLTSSGDPVAYITLLDAQQLQFERAPPIQRRETARGGPSASTDIVNAVVAQVFPYVPVSDVAAAVSRWKHLSALTQPQQEKLVSQFVIEKQRKQLSMFMVLLVIVSAVIITLIIYTLTMDKLRSIATLKLIGASDRTIIGLIVQQALSMGVVGFFFGLVLVSTFGGYFPRRVILLPNDMAVLFGIVTVVCLAASSLRRARRGQGQHHGGASGIRKCTTRAKSHTLLYRSRTFPNIFGEAPPASMQCAI